MAIDPLERLRAARRAEREIERRRRHLDMRKARAVEDALLAGYGCGEIGRALGITRQGARQLWGHLTMARDLVPPGNRSSERR